MKTVKHSIIGLMGALSVVDVVAAATANATPPTFQESILSMAPMLIGILMLFYFMIFRPQQKRQNDQRKLMEGLGAGDEIITAGGMVGRIVKLSDDFIRIALADNVEITLQRGSILKILPKGTMKSLH
jgi:preprotein translocase subunit YajC